MVDLETKKLMNENKNLVRRPHDNDIGLWRYYAVLNNCFQTKEFSWFETAKMRQFKRYQI